MQINNPLYITPTNQRTRDLKPQLAKDSLFATVMSLDNIITDVFERNDFSGYFDQALAGSLIYDVIKADKISYFDYLSSDSEMLNTIYDFVLKCHRNDVSFGTFLEGEKLAAIETIDRAYQAFKQKHELVDVADREHFVYELLQTDHSYFDNYSEVVIDAFTLDKIHFYQSKMQEKIVNLLKTQYKSLEASTQTSKVNLFKPYKAPFNAIDEVRTALKVARKLLIDGISAEDIILVTTDITEYAPLFRLLLAEYGLKGFDSLGVPLSLYESKIATSSPHVQQAFSSFKEALKDLQNKAEHYGVSVDIDQLRTTLLAQQYVMSAKVGLELTEANQLLGLNRAYKHIIFMGTDINHFPPKASDNFLFSTKDATEHFGSNSYYDSSMAQYEALKSMGENLYVLTATYSGKRKLAQSIVIQDIISDTIDVSEILSPHEMYGKVQIAKANPDLDAYLASITSDKLSAYDGLEVEGVKANHLSASQLGAYAACPLKYLYMNKLRVQAPKQESAGFEVTDKGTLMHACFENFSTRVKGDTDLDQEKFCAMMQSALDEEYEKIFIFDEKDNPKPPARNIHHDVYKTELAQGLDGSETLGVLAKFIDYYLEHAKDLEYFTNSEFEKEFALDADLKPYSLKDKEDKSYFIKGYIDRFDDLKESVNIIDYKSKKIDSTDHKKLKAITEFKDFQMGLYMLYTTQTSDKEEHNASLMTFKTDKPFNEFAKLSTLEENVPESRKKPTGIHYTQAYEDELKNEIMRIKVQIETGTFGFDNREEEVCGYCEIKHLCHQSVLNKGANYES